MKLVLVFGNLQTSPHGGIPTVNRQMLRQIARRIDPEVCAIEAWALYDEPADPDEIARALGFPSRSFVYRAYEGSKARMLAAAALARPRPDVVICTHLHLSPAARLMCGEGARYYQFLHGIECWRPVSPPMRWALRGVTDLLSNSAFTHRRFLDLNPAYRGLRNHVCSLGVAEERAHAAERGRDAGRSDDAPSILITGRVMRSEAYKGHDELIEVWPSVRKRFPGARLDIVGTGDGQDDLQAKAGRLGLLAGGAVKLWGRVSDDELRERYEACTAFAMPSRGEGFGLVYLEAMSFAKPCIASRDDAAVEVVVDEETGLTIPYGDKDALLAAITRLFADRALCARLGDAGRRRLDSKFTEAHFGDRLLAAIDSGGELPRARGTERP